MTNDDDAERLRVLTEVNKVTGDLLNMTTRVAGHVQAMADRQIYARPYGEEARKAIAGLRKALDDLETKIF
jgi:hypothetical protein